MSNDNQNHNEFINYNFNLIPLNYFHKKFFKSCCKDNFIIKDFEVLYNMIQSLELGNFEKNLILVRFRRINTYCIKNYKAVSNYYTKSKLFIIICGILNPSLLSIKFNNFESNYYLMLFWTIWSLQLSVSLITSFISFYKWDKKYFLYSSYKSRINQEIWLFLECTGKYSVDNNSNSKNLISNHQINYNLFMERIEYLFRKLKDCDLEIENNEEDDDNKKQKTPIYTSMSSNNDNLSELQDVDLENA